MRIRKPAKSSATLLAAALAAILSGCGSSGTSSQAVGPKLAIEFRSPALTASRVIPAHYKCNSDKIWIPLRWGAVPVGTKELVVYIARFGPPESIPGNRISAVLIAQQLIVGLKPTLHSLSVGRLPHGALIGSYEVANKQVPICPPRGSSQGIVFGLYALPHQQGITKGSQSGQLLNKLRAEAVAYGTFSATLGRS